MQDALRLRWSFPHQIDSSVLTSGFFCWTVCVNVEKATRLEEEMCTWLVCGSIPAKAQKRWVKRVELMSLTGNSLAGNQYPALTTVSVAKECGIRRKRETIKQRCFLIAIERIVIRLRI